MSVATFALSAASSMAGFAQKQAEADAATERYNQNVANSLAGARDEYNQLSLRQMQEQEATAQKQHVHLVEQAQKEAEVSVNAAGGNVGGLSVDNLLADVRRTTAFNMEAVDRNAKATAQQLEQQARGVSTKAQSRINSMAPGADPSPAGMMLEIAGAGIKSFAKP